MLFREDIEQKIDLRNYDRFQEIIERIKIEGMEVKLGFAMDVSECLVTQYYLQVKCDGKCNVTGEPQKWSGRKWLLSIHMTDQEIVQTALKAVLTAVEHETREKFLYRGVAIFDPHYDIEKLVELRQNPNSVVQRKNTLAL